MIPIQKNALKFLTLRVPHICFSDRGCSGGGSSSSSNSSSSNSSSTGVLISP